ncbi:DUF2125 domain-containing protein [Halocynthiibacter sp.]|uniref:DUF2125 domain-containing protein n=1 Tax=Halocynthiibacter sp. TaxID=1979210 RepID=UPI003C63466F
MRGLIIFILCGFIGWGGYWVVGSTTLESRLNTAFDEAANQGINLQYSEFGVQGFPNRFDTVMHDVDLKIPAEGIAWQAPWFTTAALSYKPWHLIASWPETQTLTVGDFTTDILSSEMQASVVFEPDVSLPLERSQMVARDLQIKPVATQQTLSISELFIATRQNPNTSETHDLLISLKQILPPADLMAAIDPEQKLPLHLSEFRSDTSLEFAGPVNRIAPPVLKALDLREAKLIWGNAIVTIGGRLTPDASGRPDGQMALKIQNWRDIFQVLVSTGLAQPGWEGALSALTLSDGDPTTLNAPLLFRDGQIWLGPFPLAQAPVLFAG